MSCGEDVRLTEPPNEYNLNSKMEEEDTEKTGPHEEEPIGPHYQDSASESPHKRTGPFSSLCVQNELNGLVSDLELPKEKGELLESRMEQWKHLDEGVKITLYRYRQKIWKNSSTWMTL